MAASSPIKVSPPDQRGLTRTSTFRPELGALRAAGVVAVLIYHLWPSRLPGGFVGVDVLFVVSGWLITSLLAGGVIHRGRIAWGAFLTRRAARLLPASTTVILVSAIASILLLPRLAWSDTAAQGLASLVGVENWYLIRSGSGYLTARDAPTVFQHFWSLGVEAQLYVVWPVLVLTGLVLLGRRLRRPTRGLLLVIGVAIAASLVWSIVDRDSPHGGDFFSTLTRLWEFGTGGVMGLTLPSLTARIPRALRVALGVLGWGALVVICLLLPGTDQYPGAIALLPVAATGAIAASGSWWPYRVRPVILTGELSYSLYLWHWPIIIIATERLGHALTAVDKALILVLTLALAVLTWRFIERRFWRPHADPEPLDAPAEPARARPARGALARLLSSRTNAGLAFALVAALCASAVFTAQFAVLRSDDDAARAQLLALSSAHGRCYGALASTRSSCPSSTSPPDAAALELASHDVGAALRDGDPACTDVEHDPTSTPWRSCRYPQPRATTTLAIVGDSHAAAWTSSLLPIAATERWNVVVYEHGGCPAIDPTGLTARTNLITDDCVAWQRAVIRRIDSDPSVTLVLTGGFYGAYTADATALHRAVLESPGFVRRLEKLVGHWTDLGKKVAVLRDTPHAPAALPECLSHAATASSCAYPRVTDDRPDDVTGPLAGSRSGVTLIDPARWTCPDAMCSPVMGGVVVLFDTDHVTRSFAVSASPLMARALKAAGWPI
jgi:peptidoglycan/LPS O-acetylase OafA/YrhL